MSNFTKKARVAFLTLFTLMTLGVFSAQAQDDNTITLAAGGSVQKTIDKSILYTIILEADGQLDISYNYNNSSNIGNGYILFTDATHNTPAQPEDNNKWNYDWDTYDHTFSMSLTKGTYYMWNTNGMWFNGAVDATFKLTSSAEIEPEPTIPVVDVEIGTPTVVTNEEYGKINPTEFPGTNVELKIITNSTTDLCANGTFLYEWLYTDKSKPDMDSPCNPISKESTPSGYVYTFQMYKTFFPVYIVQTEVSSVTYTVSFPQFDEMKEITIDTPFDATVTQIYSFTVDSDCKLGVKTSLDLDTRSGNMIYSDKSCSNEYRITCTNAQNPIPDGDKFIYTYILENAGTYYFKCEISGDYTFTIIEDTVDAEPSDITATIKSPEAGAQQITSFAITWEGQALTDGTMRGVTLTTPSGENVGLRLGLTTYKNESSVTLLALNFNPVQTFDQRGEYTIYLPQGVVLLDGRPNKEQTIVYTLVPEADEGETWFSDDSYTLDPAKDAELSELGNVTITYAYDLYKVPAKSFDDDGNVIENPNVDENDKEVSVSVNNVLTTATIDGKSIVIPVNIAATTEDVTVTIKIGAGVVKNEAGEINYAETIVYTLLGTPEESDDPNDPNDPNDPDDPSDEPTYVGGATAIEVIGTDGITAIKINWQDNKLYLNDVDDIITVESSIEIEPADISVSIEENAYLVLTFAEPFAEKATLTITIPQGYVTVGEEGVLNEFQQLTLTTTGVALVGVDSELSRVYNLNGVKMNVKKASELPAGLYIIDGKKVVVK